MGKDDITVSCWLNMVIKMVQTASLHCTHALR